MNETHFGSSTGLHLLAGVGLQGQPSLITALTAPAQQKNARSWKPQHKPAAHMLPSLSNVKMCHCQSVELPFPAERTTAQ